MSPVVQNGPVSYIVPECMAQEPCRLNTCIFGPQTANTKCIGSYLAGKWAVQNLAQLFLSTVTGKPLSTIFFRGQERFKTVLCKNLSEIALACVEKQIIYQNRGVQILPILFFRALLLKNQTAITSSILGVRSSSLDSRQFSIIPLNNTPIKS